MGGVTNLPIIILEREEDEYCNGGKNVGSTAVGPSKDSIGGEK